MSCSIGNKIKSGGFGDVYKVKLNKIDSEESTQIKSPTFALKVIQNNIYGIRCFMELIILLFCNYSYIMNCFQFHIDIKERITKILMPLASYDFSSEMIKKNISKGLSVNKRLYQIVCAVAFLHSNGIIHGDIKPSNILLHKDTVKLADFSLSSFVFENDRILYQDAYTENYRAPELWAKKGYNYKADIWALGCTFHELLYNKKFSIENPYKYIDNEKDENLKELLKKMLSVEEIDRYSIWEVLGCDYFKDNKKNLKFSLEYPKRKIKKIDDFILFFSETVSKIYPDIPYYVYEITAKKMFRYPIDKSYNIYCNETLMQYETKILEGLYSLKIGSELFKF
jgi:serine/threonine protein kinase